MQFGALRREIGLADALLYVFARALGIVSGGRVRLIKYYITAQPVLDAELTPPRRGRQIEVAEVSPEDALALPVDRPRHVIEQRLRDGGRCLVARKQGGLAGFQWFTLHDYPEDEVRCLFKLSSADRCAWDYDIYVAPECRAQPVFTRLWDRCNEVLRSSGITRTVSRINAFNGMSRRSHERLGARVVGWAGFLCVGPLQVSVFSTSPWLHVAFEANHRPVLYVSRMAARATFP